VREPGDRLGLLARNLQTPIPSSESLRGYSQSPAMGDPVFCFFPVFDPVSALETTVSFAG
jgi:hypothetical protein